MSNKQANVVLVLNDQVTQADVDKIIQSKNSTTVFDTSESANLHDVHFVVPLENIDSLNGLTKTLCLLPPTEYDLTFTIIGSLLTPNGNSLAKLVISIYNAVPNDVKPKFEYIEVLSGTWMTYDIKFNLKTLWVSDNPNYKVPVGALKEFRYKCLKDLSEILNLDIIDNLDYGSYDNHVFSFNVLLNYNLLVTGQDFKSLSIASRLAEFYPNMHVRTQLTEGAIQYAFLTEPETMLLKQFSDIDEVRTYNHYRTSTIEKLAELGYITLKMVHVEPVDEDDDPKDYIQYSLTDKGKEFVLNTRYRDSVRNGLGTDSVIINLRNGLLYKNMGFDYTSAKYNLMCQDGTALQLDISTNIDFYYADKREKEMFNRLTS